MFETSLYAPVKQFLERPGFTVKGEIGGCDLLALSGDSPPVVVVCEPKLQFNLELVLRAPSPAMPLRGGMAKISPSCKSR